MRAPSHTAILMYHAVHDSEAALHEIALEDRPYAVSLAAFRAQLDWLQASGLPIVHPQQLLGEGPLPPGVLITFDDGHASNHRLALPELQRRGLSALFFVTTDFIGQRPGFCSWAQLQDMAAQGMVIGGHGHTHRFFTDMSPAQSQDELQRSHQALLEHIGPGPHQMSFPGGRFGPAHLAQAQACGYAALHTSRVDVARTRQDLVRGLPRVAVRAHTGLAEFAQMASGHALYYARAKAVWALKSGVKRLLGDVGYHTLYKAVKK